MKHSIALSGAGDHVVPVNHHSDSSISFYATVSVTVKPIADRDLATSIIDATGQTGTGGVVPQVCDALVVTTSADTTFYYVQGD